MINFNICFLIKKIIKSIVIIKEKKKQRAEFDEVVVTMNLGLNLILDR